ncbi:MaoC family dehydratase [Thaumasiovibrio subtropicus]|uniref:MaoC family dehydratase n=1 Tax=Thaumasiovibrio subtropicus TaxID=1891207 RepID=UPI000B35558A|nr:MaoC family dehydratase [Thaumasiovibrio subtropicus]
MKVTDILKHRSESLSKRHAVLMQKVTPIRDYWGELKLKANQSHLFDALLDGNKDESANEANAAPTLKVDAPKKPEIALKPEAQALFEELQEKLDTVIHTGDWITVDQERINQFGEVTEDMQWIHTDPERAETQSPFKTTIAHGFLTLALLPRLTDSVDPDNTLFPTAKMVVNIGLNQVRFPYPVKAGNRVRAVSTLSKVTPVRKGLEIEREIKVEIEGVRRPGCIVVSVIQLHF